MQFRDTLSNLHIKHTKIISHCIYKQLDIEFPSLLNHILLHDQKCLGLTFTECFEAPPPVELCTLFPYRPPPVL